MKFRKIFILLLGVAIMCVACGTNSSRTLPTLIPTLKFPTPIIPTATPTPLPSPTPTYPPKLESTGERFEVLELNSGETLFFDKDLKYLLTLSPEWLVVPIEEKSKADYLALVQLEISKESVASVNEFYNNSDIFRMVALDYTLKYSEPEGILVNLSVSYRNDDWSANTDLNDILLYEAAVSPTVFPESIVTGQTIQTNSHGIQYARMLINKPANTNVHGQPLTTVMMIVKRGDGVLIFTGSAKQSLFPLVEPAFQQIIDSLEFVE